MGRIYATQNTKTPLLVTVHQKGELTSLKALYSTLKKHNYTYEYHGWKDLRRSRETLFRFFRNNPLWDGTQKALSRITGIAERTIKKILSEMREQNLFYENFLGKGGKTRLKHYHFKPAFMGYLQPIINEGHVNKTKDSLLQPLETLKSVISSFKDKKREKGCRNPATFVASVALNKLTGGEIGLEQAIAELKPGFDLSSTGDNDFNYKQFCATVASGLLPGRTFNFKQSTLRSLELI